ncbi:DUF4838 domain-containing protein [Cohnella silvisoli]|uniref:DUF4838 domain-containing protein n=1 Tax=Cohnella silvisoli TaxID=2873699 RepID=A0ABV1KSX0_9BACL|nr:DUF4838 domain-containing protein [Cohnella silvisoli]MCD9021671.1 DUF4838 domain-containing protein [Cohnella silvisoli]
MMEIVRDGRAMASIVVEQETTALFAAEELQKYVLAISGCELPVRSADHAHESASIFIGSVTWCKEVTACDLNGELLTYDGFMLKSINRGLILAGQCGRGILYAVYALLERLGCRWYSAGERGAVIPSRSRIELEELDAIENPDFEIRSFTEDASKDSAEMWIEEMIETIDWCGKNRINSFHVHANPSSELKAFEPVIREIKKRGMRYEFGGHGVERLVDREWFEQKPYLFIEKNGQRIKSGNVCGSSDEALNLLTEGVKALIVRKPYVDMFRLWFADVNDGSWCECRLCKDMPPATQQLNVINRIADGIREQNAEMKIDMLLYHDTIDMNNVINEPRSNVYGLFAARERCYAHSLGDPSCEMNRRYNQMLIETYRKFGVNTYVFDYYADIILFTKMKLSMTKVIVEDLRHYKAMGIRNAAALMFGRFSWWAYSSNLYVFAKAAWNTDFKADESLREFYESCYPDSIEEMLEYDSLIEHASYDMLTFCGYEGFIDALRNIPPQNHEFHREHIERIKRSIDLYVQGLALLERLTEHASGKQKERLIDEKNILLITLKEAEAIYYQMQGRYLYDIGGISDIEQFEVYMDKAIELKNEMKQLFVTIPVEVKGAAEDRIFLSHLCDDQIQFLNDLKENPKRVLIWD